ncbi:hypothetical protein H0E87_005311 [Populus deltoides]|uniref:Uncharacterized protein n=1 Tax=Populus deltoides TaxID=3696 RepID=A0A8T2ZIZ1_POPDE|nr:hypothetical protein H0E87_005311 [Populus deltoides]
MQGLTPRGLGPCPDPTGLGFGSVSRPKGDGGGFMSGPKRVGGLGSCPDLKRLRVGSASGSKGVESMSEPKRVGVWVLWSLDARGLGPSRFRPKRTQGGLGFGSFEVRMQGVWGLGPSMSGPKRVGSWVRVRTQGGLGDGGIRGWVRNPRGIRGWVLWWRDPRGLECEPFCVRTQEGFGDGSVSGPKGGWGMGLCPDPMGLGFGSFSDWTQGVLGLGPSASGSNGGSGIGPCLDLRGLCGSVSQPKGFGSRSGPKKVGV